MIFLALAVVALILGAIALIRSRGEDITAWAVVALAVLEVLAHR